MKLFRIWYKNCVNLVWANTEMEARKILKEQYSN